MAYDRYDTRNDPREERSRWRDERGGWGRERDRGSARGGDYRSRGDDDDERGFFERAGDQIASWFGDDEAERRPREDRMRDEREGGWGGQRDEDRGRFVSRERGEDRGRFSSGNPDRYERERNENRGVFSRGGSSERDYNPSWQRELRGSDERDIGRDRDFGRDRELGRDRSYRPMTGDYGRSEGFFAAGGMPRRERAREDRPPSDSPWERDEYRSTSRAGTRDWSDRSRHEDPHYSSWRQRHLDELDRDYDEYRRENHSRFEDDFAGWRERRQQKRGLLGQIREHMEVVGSDEEHVGTVDRVAGERLILAKSDPESGGAHHSLSCADIDRVEGERVILDCKADEARHRWRDESRSRALFEREDQGEMGPRMLDRSFEGTYR